MDSENCRVQGDRGGWRPSISWACLMRAAISPYLPKLTPQLLQFAMVSSVQSSGILIFAGLSPQEGQGKFNADVSSLNSALLAQGNFVAKEARKKKPANGRVNG